MNEIEAQDLLARAVGNTSSGDPDACMARLLALETPEDAEKIRAALEPGWEDDWAGAFGRAARKVLG